jgi:CHAD domain-containing protein
VAPIFGKDMKRYAQQMAEVTEMLGDHQDAHVAQGILRELASHAETDGLTGLSLGLLHEYEADEEILDRYRFAELWPVARRDAKRAGMG